MFLKIMSDDGLSEKDYRKKYKMIEVTQFEFYDYLAENSVNPIPFVGFIDSTGKEREISLQGTVYVMNDQGKTVETWLPNS